MVNIKSNIKRIISVIFALSLPVFCILNCKIEQISLDDFSKVTGNLEVHFIDVGQADCILVKQEDKVMLIDSGTMATSNDVVDYIKSLDINKIDIIVATHQHHDHIGGFKKVLDNFEVETIYMPDLRKENIKTKSYKSFEKSISKWEEKGNNVLFPKDKKGDFREFDLGKAKVKFLAPINKRYLIKNNYSIVTKIIFGKTKILLMSDAEAFSELQILNSNSNLEADVLKIGHHGSISSTTNDFLNAVNPDYAVISVGKNNDYNYPCKQTMNKLKKRNITVYRTDQSGTIIMKTDGKNISFNTEPGDYKSGKDQ